MARYIDADKIDYTVTVVGQDEYAGYRAVAFESDIDAMPTADVAEVRHGEWVDGHCTECGEEAMYSTFDEAIYDYDWEENLQYSHTETHVEYNLTDYCPNCGAKMDGKGENDA